MAPPEEQKALLLLAKQGELQVQSRPVPKPGAGELIVRNEAVGLNPADWKIWKWGLFVDEFPAVLGVDAAGVVEAVGDGVTNIKAGDRVLYEGELGLDTATFQQYTLVRARFAAKLPESLTFDQGGALPLAITTAAVGLYHEAGGTEFTAPWTEGGKGKYAGTPIAVIGGSSVVGSLAIQWSRLSGFSPIITTASLKNAPLLKSFGATHVLDRNLSATELWEEVVQIASGPLSAVFDAISLRETQNAAFDLLAPGGKLVTVLPPNIDEDRQKNANGRTVTRTAGIVHNPQNVEFGKELFESLTGFLDSGELKPLRVEVLPGGLGGITAGLAKLENNQVSAEKLIVRPPETS
ncbi:GroES-like protein [Trametes elegans]|nr:GroES-like protein [Trametes elegans]